MGRVDDAMRRAAEAAGGAVVEPPAEDMSDADVMRLGRDVVDGPVSPEAAADAPNVLDHLDASVAEKVVVDPLMMAACREQYRRLAAMLHRMQAESGLKVVMIASAAANEGKSLTASNLAMTLSESYRRSVLLIDADLRRPTLHTIFKVPAARGLSGILDAIEERDLPVHAVSANLTILPAGRPSADPMAGLTSQRMRRLIGDARDAFDWVIIDTPPIGLLTDANLLGSMVDGAILVVRADITPCDLVQRSVEALGRDRLLGVVLNGTTARSAGRGYYKYYNHYYGKTNPASPGS
jgi:capsular exopolysaccharide synthesis family protein